MVLTKSKLLLLAVVFYLLSAGGSYFIFKSSQATSVIEPVTPTVVTPAGSKFKVDPNLPKDQPCPLNGQMYTKPEKDIWTTRRPLTVMIENHEDSRPQSGLSYSDVVYEAVAEGGITRLLAVFYCGATAQDVQLGPVRSARTYFIDFASEYGDKPLYAHVGGANSPGPANALGQLEDYGWVGANDLNQFSIGFPTFWRDYDRLGHEVATEHTMYSTTEKLLSFAAQKRGLSNVDKKGVSWDKGFVPYSFKDDASAPAPLVGASFTFWDRYTAYFVKWIYDKATNSFQRENGGAPQFDKDNDQQLTAKNIVLLYMLESNANDGYENNAHLLYKTKGSGKAKILLDGKVIEANWQKKDRTSRLKLTDAKTGAEIKFNRGRIWFEVLPSDTDVSIQ